MSTFPAQISRIERLIIWGLLAVLAAFSVACIFWIPFDRLKLLRPIPANAVLVGSQRNPGSCLENMATNVFFKSFFDSNETAWKNLRSNRYAARILASRSIIAYTPDIERPAARGGQPSIPAVVISSWIGGWTPLLRWALWIHPPGDIVPLGDYDGHRLWACKRPFPLFGKASFFSFAVDEGVFIGCLSQSRNGIVYLLRNYDGRKDSILNLPACNSLLAGGIAGRAPGRFEGKIPVADQVWLRVDLPNAVQNKPLFAVCSLDALEDDYLAATIRFAPDPGFVRQGRAVADSPSRSAMAERGASIQLDDSAGLNRNLAQIGKMYACSPSIVALIPSEMVAGGLNELVSPAWAKAVKPVFAQSSGTNNICLLMVLTGAYGGQFGNEPFRIAVPTVLLAVPGCRQDSFRPVPTRSEVSERKPQGEESVRVKQTKTAVLELLDLINLKYRLGLILNSALPPAGQCPVFAIESTASGPLNSLPVEDQPAFAFYDDWFLLASNSAGLRKLLLNFQSQSVPANGGNNKWLHRASSRRTKSFIWIDPGEGGKALRFALTASIMMLDSNARDSSRQNTIKILKAARSWLENISSLKNCAAWMESENGKAVIRLEAGQKSSN